MSVYKIRNSLAVRGSVTIGSDTVLSRGAADRLDLAAGDTLRLIGGTLDLGTDFQIARSAANVAGPASGDTWDMTAGQMLVPNGTAALATADFGAVNGRFRAHAEGGTLQVGIRINGTVFALSGTAVVSS